MALNWDHRVNEGMRIERDGLCIDVIVRKIRGGSKYKKANLEVKCGDSSRKINLSFHDAPIVLIDDFMLEINKNYTPSNRKKVSVSYYFRTGDYLHAQRYFT